MAIKWTKKKEAMLRELVRKRKYRKRYNRKYVPSKVIGRPSGFSRLPTVTKLRYTEGFNLTSTAGVLSTHFFRWNSIYAPNATGSGHQPMGYTQWASFYNHYTVLGAKLRIIGSVENDSNLYRVGLLSTDDTSIPYTTADGLVEAGKRPYRLINGLSDQTFDVSLKWSSKKFFGLKDVQDNDEVGSVIGSSPAELAFCCFWLQAWGGAATVTVNAQVVIEFIVKFKEPKELAVSSV